MIFRYPKYYKKFKCIASQCEDTCCAGWEIDIDDKSFEYYRSIGGEFGERLRNCIKEYADEAGGYESHGFVLTEEKRCPFLDDENLCELYKELGEDALCDVCTDTPRSFLEYGGQREMSISVSCGEAGRLIYGTDEKITFVEEEIDEELDFEESDEEMLYAEGIRTARDKAIDILQNRQNSLEERIRQFLHFAERVQEVMNQNEPALIIKFVKQYEVKPEKDMKIAQEECYEFFLQRFEPFTNLESIKEEWKQFLDDIQDDFIESASGKELYFATLDRWKNYLILENREYEYEHTLVYYAFLFLAFCVDDYDFLSKAKLVVTSFLMIRAMDLSWFLHHDGQYSKEDRVMIARIYAKEVEHSEENLEILNDEFLFEDAFEVENLCKVI